MSGLLNLLVENTITVFGFEMEKVLFYVLLGVAILIVLFLIGFIGSKIEKKNKQK